MPYFLTILLFFTLSSCGIKPLYEFDRNNESLTQIELGKISGEKAYLIKNQLINTLNPYGKESKKLYVIDVSIESTTSDAIVQKDSTILEKTINLNVTYSLRKQGSTTIITKGHFITKSNFVNTVSPYGSFVQENSSYEDALKLSVSNLKHKLIIFFATKQQNKK